MPKKFQSDVSKIDKPREIVLRHTTFEERKDGRLRTHSTCLIGGSQTVQRYQSFEERKDIKGEDTFDLSDWKSNCATLPGFAYVFCTVLTSSPNS